MLANFSIDKNVIKALLKAVPKHDIRFYLVGVHVKIKGNNIVLTATTGHFVVCYQMYNKGDVTNDLEFIIPKGNLEKAIKICERGPIFIDIVEKNPENPSYKLKIEGMECVSIDGIFPNVAQVFPDSVSGEVAQFDSEYIGTLGEISKSIFGKDSHIYIHHNGDDGAWVSFKDPNLFGLIMPLRNSGAYQKHTINENVPAWVKS